MAGPPAAAFFDLDKTVIARASMVAMGKPLYRQAIAMIARRNDEIFGCLSEEEQALLGSLLDRLVAHAARQDGTTDIDEI